MKRDILLRGKRIDTNTWIESDIAFVSDDGEQNRGFVVTGFDYNGVNMPYNFYTLEVYPDSIGQFTGLLDKNGKKIFEGDIVSYFTEDAFTDEPILASGMVAWIDGSFCVKQIFGTKESYCNSFYGPYGREFAWEELDVIGNVFDNSEMDKNNG